MSDTGDSGRNAGRSPDERTDGRARSFPVRLSTAEMEAAIDALGASSAPGAAELAVRLQSIYDAWFPDDDGANWSCEPS
jgi:hypothetical protein